MTDDSRQPWEQQPGETPPAYAAYCLYRDSPPAEQRIRDISIRIYGGTEVRRCVSDWSQKYHWRDRTCAWLAHKSEMEQAAINEALAKERVDAARERLETGRLGVKFAMKWMAKNYLTAEDVAASSIPALLKVCADLARIEDGESTERVDQTMRVITADDLTDDELARIAAGSSR